MPEKDRIGELSRQAGGNIETLPSTSGSGLLPKARREERRQVSGYDRDDGQAEQQHTAGPARPALYAPGELGASAHFDIEPLEKDTARPELDR